MKLRGSLACLLLALCLGRGEASPLLNAGASAQGVGEAIGHGVGDAISHGIGEAFGQGAGEAAPSGIRDAVGPAVGDAFGHRVGEAIHQGVGEAAHALGNTGSEAGRQAENIIRHGLDGVHSSWQGMPGSNGASGTNGQPPSGGHGTFGSQGGLGAHSQGNPGGSGTPWGPGHPGGSDGSFGTNSLGSSWGQGGNGGSQNMGTNAQVPHSVSPSLQGTVAQPGYGSVRGNSNTECTNSPPSGSGGSSSSSGEISKESSRLLGGSQGNYQNSQTSSGIFGFDTFWKALNTQFLNIDKLRSAFKTEEFLNWHALFETIKKKLPFLNWDAFPKLEDMLCALAGCGFYRGMYCRTWLLADISIECYLGVPVLMQYRLSHQPMGGVTAALVFQILSFRQCSIGIIVQYLPTNDVMSDAKGLPVCYENFIQEQLDVVLPVQLCSSLIIECPSCIFKMKYICRWPDDKLS
ncbi:Dermokine [Pteropus alecto]|uniref:Dermokine n=1 Tax=Pteropus alecto TaxID=9402 RepID=L5K4S6_PTEAL|nr:Dermokine [Pteropus alecto]